MALVEAIGMILDAIVYTWAVSVGSNVLSNRRHSKDELVVKLRITLLRVNLVMEMAEWHRFNCETVSSLLTQLKSAAYDTHDVLGEIEYQNLETRIQSGNSLKVLPSLHQLKKYFTENKTPALPSLLTKFLTENKTLITVDRLLEHVTNELEQAIRLLGKPHEPIAEFTGMQRETSSLSLMMGPQLFGREKEKKMMIQRLLVLCDSTGPKKGNFSVLPIVGNRGIGKTTLAKHVYNDKEVIDNFHLRVWVSASKNYDVTGLIKEIVLSNTNLTAQELYSYKYYGNANKAMVSKRILIVLDDIQNGESLDLWKRTCSSLKLESQGSVILVTTQSKTVAEMGTTDAISLQGLSDDVCWSFVEQCRFGKDEMGSNSNLEDIGRQIAAKLEGSPLAAKIMGGILNKFKHAQQWSNILNSEIWQLWDEENHILPALVLSYLCLPMSLKQCFSLCSVFPKGCALPRDLLISVWIADSTVGLEGDVFIEDLGSKQFNELVGRYFIQGTLENPSLFVMHNLIHELSQIISRNESICLDETATSIDSNSVRHLSVNKTEVDYQRISGCKKLRSLLFLNGHKYDLVPVIDRLFNELTCLRMVYLSRCNLNDLPEKIGNLKYLQYLDISYTEIRCFPPAFCKLYNLKVLDITHCPVESFPPGFSQLVNLRIVRTSLAINTMIDNFGNLTSLENLSHFSVQKNSSMLDLKGMTRLRGGLAITGLEYCLGKDDAAQACLSNKKHIVDLTLEWCQNDSYMGEEHIVLEHLEPQPNLKMLKIKYCRDKICPSWLRRKCWPYLSELVIEGCTNFSQEPDYTEDLWHIYQPAPNNLPVLKSLCMINCKEIISLPFINFHDFTHLECLEVRDCPKLQYDGEARKLSLPTSLKRLVIESCGHFENVVSDSLPSLCSLRYFGLRNSKYIKSLSNQIMERLSSLEVLEVCNCAELSGLELESLTSLKNLSISSCPMLVKSVQRLSNEKAEIKGLPQLSELTIDNTCLIKLSWLRTPPCSLQTLTISNSPEQTAFDGDSIWLQGIKSSLKKLIFSDCGDLNSLPKDIISLISLEQLSISGCPKLKHLPENTLPRNLSLLRFNETIEFLPEQLQRLQASTSTQLQPTNQFWETSSSLQQNSRKRQRVGVEEDTKALRGEYHGMESEVTETEVLDREDEDDFQTQHKIPATQQGQQVTQLQPMNQFWEKSSSIQKNSRKRQREGVKKDRKTLIGEDHRMESEESEPEEPVELDARLKDIIEVDGEDEDDFRTLYKIPETQPGQQFIQLEQMNQFWETSSSLQKNSRKGQRGDRRKEDPEMELEEAQPEELVELDDRLKDITEEDGDDEDDFRTQYKISETQRRQQLSEVYGRGGDKERIIQLLLQSGNNHRSITDDGDTRRIVENVSTLPIVGVGGVGKTTLAELIYSDQKVQDHFQLKFWCSVSGSFKKASVYNLISGNAMFPTELDDPNEIWVKKYMRKKFLLVLEDVWNVNDQEWQQFCTSLRSAPEGSMILVTACSEEVAEVMGTIHTYALKGLPEDTYVEYFKRCAFCFEEPATMTEHESIKTIALRMEGSPLAAKVLGATFNMDFSKEHWDSITQRISELREGENNNIQVALELGYEYLPDYLKKCFTFFSCFPDGHLFDEDALISMWVAVGMISPEKDILMEEVGSCYLQELTRRSLIQQSYNNDGFNIHRIIHQMVRKKAISPDHYVIREEGILYIKDPYGGHHLSVCKDSHPNELLNLRTDDELQSLLVLNKPHPILMTPTMFSRLKMLRLLVLKYCQIEEISDSIGELNNLCYLDISHSKARYLPESICGLINLEILDVMHCPLNELPRGITKLQKLRRLRMKEEMFSKISEIGNLSSLQDLPQFCVLKKAGHGINELTDMKQLHRCLWIKNLENVESREVAGTYILCNKGHLDSLILEWSLDRSTSFGLKSYDYFEQHNKVLESLVPHPNLKVLQIANYCGSVSPSWLYTQMLPLLSKIWLKDCYNMKELSLPCSLAVMRIVNVGIRSLSFPRDTKLGFCALSDVHIERCPNLTSLEKWLMPKSLPGLKSLHISYCEGLVFLPVEFEGFSYLENLEITACTNLKWPSTLVLPSGVRKLVLDSCGDQEIALPGCLENLMCLNTLGLAGFSHIESLLLGSVQSLTALRSLAIASFTELSSFEGLSHLCSLKELSIFNCPKLVQLGTSSLELNVQEVMSSLEKLSVDHTALLKLPGLKIPPPTLQILRICDSQEIEVFTSVTKDWLLDLKSLRELSFLHCGQVRSLPSDLCNLISLQSLCLNDCPEIKSLPEKQLPNTLRIKCINCDPELAKLVELHKTIMHQSDGYNK